MREASETRRAPVPLRRRELLWAVGLALSGLLAAGCPRGGAPSGPRSTPPLPDGGGAMGRRY
jgi:hypothetical protein